jgi:hypothetical protein
MYNLGFGSNACIMGVLNILIKKSIDCPLLAPTSTITTPLLKEKGGGI